MHAIAKGLVAATLAGFAAGSAHAADIQPLAAPAPLAAAPAPAGWDGAYLGVNAGYGPGTATNQFTPETDIFETDATSFDFSGAFLGAQAGYNVALSNGFVIGLEGDLDWANETGSVSNTFSNILAQSGTAEVSTRLDWTGAITGHLGYAFDAFMPYVLGGVGFAHNTLTNGVAYNPPNDAFSHAGSTTNTQIGYTVGAGVAALLSSDISLFGEVRYSDYGTADYSGTTRSDAEAGPVSLTDTSLRAGLDFHL